MTEIPFENTDPKYDRLVDVLHRAYRQAATGKGKERHANDLPFDAQPMQTISQLLDSPHGLSFQAIKKIVEGVKLPTVERQTAELLGAINYLAGLIIFIENKEYGGTKKPEWRFEATDENGKTHWFTHEPKYSGLDHKWVVVRGFRTETPVRVQPPIGDSAAQFSLAMLPSAPGEK